MPRGNETKTASRSKAEQRLLEMHPAEALTLFTIVEMVEGLQKLAVCGRWKQAARVALEMAPMCLVAKQAMDGAEGPSIAVAFDHAVELLGTIRNDVREQTGE